MNLRNGVLRPGTVLKVLDKGCIKAQVPGLFSREDIDKLPPIMPFPFSGNPNSFSSIRELEEVWVLSFTDNPLQLFWLRKDKMFENNTKSEKYDPNHKTQSLLKEKNVEVLCNRENDLTWATLYFSDGSGWVIRNDESVIQISPEGNISLDTGLPNCAIGINNNGISLGKTDISEHSATYADELVPILLKVVSEIKSINKKLSNINSASKIAAANPKAKIQTYAAAVAKATPVSKPKFDLSKDDIEQIVSVIVSLQ